MFENFYGIFIVITFLFIYLDLFFFLSNLKLSNVGFMFPAFYFKIT